MLYASPQAARQAPPEEFLYLARLHAGPGVRAPDFLAVVDAQDGRIVHETPMPNVGSGLPPSRRHAAPPAAPAAAATLLAPRRADARPDDRPRGAGPDPALDPVAAPPRFRRGVRGRGAFERDLALPPLQRVVRRGACDHHGAHRGARVPVPRARAD